MIGRDAGPAGTVMPHAGLGFRVRSGRAIAALVIGSPREPELADCRQIALADAAVPESVQPYHAALRHHQLSDLRVARYLVTIVERVTRQSVAALLKEYHAREYRIDGAALVVGSLVDPATIGNQHMRAHALEGHLFRTSLAETLAAAGLRCSFILERSAYETIAVELSRGTEDVTRRVAGLRLARTDHWRADEKLAALGAWAALASTLRRDHTRRRSV